MPPRQRCVIALDRILGLADEGAAEAPEALVARRGSRQRTARIAGVARATARRGSKHGIARSANATAVVVACVARPGGGGLR